MNLKQIITAILLFGIIEFQIKAGFFSKGSLDKPVEIDEKQKVKIKLSPRISNTIFFDGTSELELEIHNDSDWNISEIKLKITVEKDSRAYIFTEYYAVYEKLIDGKPINPKVKRASISKNQTQIWKTNVGNFINQNFTYSIESIKGFED
jgi:hypothetical protein